MSEHILHTFKDQYPITITEKHLQQIEILCQQFELRNQHSQALNTPTLGVYKVIFTTKDQTDVFDIFNIDQTLFKKTINKIPSVNKDFKVVSDAFNLLITWIAHNIFISKIPNQKKEIGLFSLFKLLFYKFFTSAINHYLIYKTNEEMMLLTYSELNAKFDIIKYGTWKKVLEAKAQELIDPKNLHYKSFINYNNDDKILYIISDCNTRIRLQLQRFIDAFNEVRLNSTKTYVLQDIKIDTIDGNRIVRETVNVIDALTNAMMTRILNQEEFINHKYINDLLKQFKSIRDDAFARFLQYVINTAITQNKTYDLDKVVIKDKNKNEILYVGIRILITEFIQKTYRYCINTGINMNSKKSIYLTVSNLYRSSRMNDQILINIKNSIHYLVENSELTVRQASMVSYKICFILYLLRLTFDDL
jgi:hypothetical protein